MLPGRSFPWRSRSSLLLLCGLLALFCARDERMRRDMQEIRTPQDLQQRWRGLLWPPWRALQAYVSIDDDVHLYYEYSRVILGEEADCAYIARSGRVADPDEIE